MRALAEVINVSEAMTTKLQELNHFIQRYIMLTITKRVRNISQYLITLLEYVMA